MKFHDLVVSGRVDLTKTVKILFKLLKSSYGYKDISRVAGVSPSLISAIINRDHVPLLDTLFVIHDNLQIDYEVIVRNVKGKRSVVVNGTRAADYVKSRKMSALKSNIDALR